MDGKEGAGIYEPDREIHKALGSYASIFPAESSCYQTCALEVRKTKLGKNIMMDSPTALNAPQQYY